MGKTALHVPGVTDTSGTLLAPLQLVPQLRILKQN
jgi:hypothetical protein